MNTLRVFKDSQSQIHFSLRHPKYFPVYYYPHNHIKLHHYCHLSYHQKQHFLEKGLDPPEKTKREKRLLSQPLSLHTNHFKTPNLQNRLQKRLKPQIFNQTWYLVPAMMTSQTYQEQSDDDDQSVQISMETPSEVEYANITRILMATSIELRQPKVHMSRNIPCATQPFVILY